MGEAVHVARAEDEASSQLERVSSQFVLRLSGGFGAGASLGVVAAQQVQQVGALELEGVVGFALFVNEQRKSNARFFAKCAGINAITEPDSGQRRAAVPEGLFVRAQLRDVLAAEDSAVMTQESDYGRLAEPQGTQPHFPAVRIRQGNHREAAIQCVFHVVYSESPEWYVKPGADLRLLGKLR